MTDKKYQPTVDGMAERFIDEYHGRVFRVYPQKYAIYWDGKRFRKDEKDSLVSWAREIVKKCLKLAVAGSSTDKDLLNLAMKLDDDAGYRKILNTVFVREEVKLEFKELDSEPWMLGTNNGYAIDLHTITPRRMTLDDRITKAVKADYDPEATCPLWDAMLERALPDVAVRAYLYRFLGYALTGSIEEKRMLFLYGPKDTAKSLISDVMNYVFGDYTEVMLDGTFARVKNEAKNSEELAMLAGVRLALSSELPEDVRFNDALVKKLTGTRYFSAMRKFEHPFKFLTQFKIMIDTNYLPQLSAKDDAVWIRVHVIEFLDSIPEPEQDKKLGAKLEKEASGILNRILDGLRDFNEQGGLKPPPAVLRARDKYRETQNDLTRFIDAFYVRKPDARGIHTTEVLDKYNEWAKLPRPIGPVPFAKLMRAAGFESFPSSGKNYWRGLASADEATENESEKASQNGSSSNYRQSTIPEDVQDRANRAV